MLSPALNALYGLDEMMYELVEAAAMLMTLLSNGTTVGVKTGFVLVIPRPNCPYANIPKC